LKRISSKIEGSILVVDATHGGCLLAEKLNEQSFDVTLYDLYGTITSEKETKGIKVIKKIPLSMSYDVIVSPVHSPVFNPLLDNQYANILSFHEAVRWLAVKNYCSMLNKMDIIEVTGTKGKTSTVLMLAKLIRDPLVYTSSIGSYAKIDEKSERISGASITPVKFLEILDLISQREIPLPDYLIVEISLGFIGVGCTNVLTTLDYDYKIARGRLNAVYSKLSSLRNTKGIIIAPFEYMDRTTLPDNRNISTYLRSNDFNNKILRDKRARVFTYSARQENGYIDVKIKERHGNAEFLLQTKISPILIEDIVVATITLKCKGFSNEKILERAREITTIKGRCSLHICGTKKIIYDKNAIFEPSIVENILQWADNIEVSKVDKCMVIGGQRNFCGQLDEKKINTLKKVLEKYGDWKIFYGGDLGEDIASYISKHGPNTWKLISVRDGCREIDNGQLIVILGDFDSKLYDMLKGDGNGNQEL